MALSCDLYDLEHECSGGTVRLGELLVCPPGLKAYRVLYPPLPTDLVQCGCGYLRQRNERCGLPCM